MKKSFLYPVLALIVCLFTACSQEEIVSESGQSTNKVRLSVKVPAAGPVARAADLAVDGYTMQCIMELVNAGGTVIADSRKTQTVATDGTVNFEFDKPSGEYTCLFWAEYLKDGKSFYKTTDGLVNVAYVANKNNDLFNNKAADAFCGKIASSSISAGSRVTLKRPFARIAVSKADLAKLGASLNQVVTSINGAQGYNVLTGRADKAVTLSNTQVETASTPIAVPTDGDFAFFCYAFSSDVIAKNSSITFSDSNNPETSKKTLSITADQMKTIDSNTAVNLKPETGGDDGKINVDITIDNSFGNGGESPEPEVPGDKPETPAGAVEVGNYLYADGTWGTEAANAVAVVFALAEEDATTNYDGITFTDNKVHGWAVSINQSAKTAWTAEALTAPIEGMTAGTSTTDILGYKNTKAAGSSHPAITACSGVGAALTGNNTSGWYIPAIGQLAKLMESVAAINAKLGTITGGKLIPPAGTSGNMNFWSSTFFEEDATDATTKIYQYQYVFEDTSFKSRSEKPNSSAGVIRPIVTF